MPVRLGNIGKVVTKFKVGDIVDVARRKQPGQNKDGGVARVLSVEQAGDAVVYRVKYVLEGRNESNLREAELKLHEEVTQPRSAACFAATAEAGDLRKYFLCVLMLPSSLFFFIAYVHRLL